MFNGLKTYIGATVIFLAEILRLSGVEIGDAEGITNSVMTLIGVGVVVYGRFVAKPKG